MSASLFLPRTTRISRKIVENSRAFVKFAEGFSFLKESVVKYGHHRKESAMADKDLRTLLEDLRGELHKAESLDDKGRALLHELDADIRDLLQRSGEAPAPSGDALRAALQSAIDHFHITHPQLTILLSELTTSLSNAGI
ncbi:MAG: DUF4404 family protein [Anaerolineae bacterium CFX3]|nr:DUF4404 family protein [Anaerolineae bacterium CFX3]MCQ3947063.1 hypothetical protein [Anaerolineae bacterium]